MSYKELDRLGVSYSNQKVIIRDDDGKAVRDEDGNIVQKCTGVASVLLPISSVQWCHMAMREGEHYVGGCCTHTSAMQDIVNSVFRDSGWIKAREFRELADLALNHDGFEAFESEETVESLSALDDPWEVIGAVWCAVKDVLAPDTLYKPTPRDLSNFDEAVTLARNLLWQISLAKFFTTDEPMRKGQRHANHTYSMMRILPALRTVYDHLENMSEQRFPVFGVRKKSTKEVVANGLGLCIYETREQAGELFRIWREAGNNEIDDWEILPAVVSVNDGLTWVEDEKGTEK